MSTSTGEEHMFDSERMLELIKQEILEAANEGNCVLVGRGSACALAGQPGCFHVFVYATASAKKNGSRSAFPHRAQHAEQHLAGFDKRRAAVIRKFYQQEWCSRGLYHMLLNSCIGTEAMISAVQCAAGLCAPVRGTAVASLNCDARNARRNARENLPGNCARGSGVIEGGDGFIVPCAPRITTSSPASTPGISVTSSTAWSMLIAAHQRRALPRTSRLNRLPSLRSRPSP